MPGVKGKTGKHHNHGKQNTPKRNEEQRLQDRCEMMKLLRRGYTKARIAEKFGVSPALITYDYKLVIKQVIADKDKDTEFLIAKTLAEYDEVILEAWSAWEKSKLTAESVSESIWDGGSKTTTTKEGQCGDSSFLKTILEAIKAKRELLGINPAKEIDFKGRMDVVNWEVLAQGIPDGPVPDVIEAEIVKMLPAPDEANQSITETSPAIPSTNGEGNGKHTGSPPMGEESPPMGEG